MAEEQLTTGDFSEADDPIALFTQWLEEAVASEPNDPTATALATVDGDGMPDVRMVLLKAHDENGFVFYTNFESTKGREILATGKAAMCFHWKSRRRQVRVRGRTFEVSRAEADAYFASRARGSRIGAWASDQSRPLESRAVLAERARDIEAKYPGEDVPRPPHWSGFRIVPVQIEFWQDGEFRLHDRVLFSRTGETERWSKARLYP